MRYRLMASYRGSPFEAGIGPAEGDIVLFAACPPPEDLGFEPATGHWRKQVRISEVQAVWESRPVGSFHGERCMVLDDLGDRLHIGFLGHDGYQAERLGYWQVDRGVFELVAPRTEVSDILEERTEYPRSTSPGYQPARSQTAAQPISQQPASSGPTGFEPMPYVADTGSWLAPADFATGGYARQPGPAAVPDDTSGVALPVTAEAPLPLEAQALRAASASRWSRQPAAPQPGVPQTAVPQTAVPQTAAQRRVAPPAPAPAATARPAAEARAPGQARQRRAARRRMATERLFADLAGQAGIPADSYSVGEEVDGAFCLVQSEHGFQVFHSSGGARHEVQVFASEEAACFYLFGVLAAEAVRTGSLVKAAVTAPA